MVLSDTPVALSFSAFLVFSREKTRTDPDPNEKKRETEHRPYLPFSSVGETETRRASALRPLGLCTYKAHKTHWGFGLALASGWLGPWGSLGGYPSNRKPGAQKAKFQGCPKSPSPIDRQAVLGLSKTQIQSAGWPSQIWPDQAPFVQGHKVSGAKPLGSEPLGA